LEFNSIFSTIRLYRALKIYSLVKKLIPARQFKILRFGERNNMANLREITMENTVHGVQKWRTEITKMTIQNYYRQMWNTACFFLILQGG